MVTWCRPSGRHAGRLPGGEVTTGRETHSAIRGAEYNTSLNAVNPETRLAFGGYAGTNRGPSKQGGALRSNTITAVKLESRPGGSVDRGSEAALSGSHSPTVKFIMRIEEGDPVAGVREDAVHGDTLEIPSR